MAFKDSARFYEIQGRRLPSVTTIISVLDKGPALLNWYAKQERTAFETAMVNLAAAYERKGEAIPPGHLVEELLIAVKGVRAAEKARDAAANVGTQAHAMIEWLTRRMIGEDPGPEPTIPDASLVAVESWRDWAKSVDFTPIHVEPVVYHLKHGYAGRADFIAKVSGRVLLGDYKTSVRLYAEAHLQATAYRHAAATMGYQTEGALLLRLPKTLDDVTFEALEVPDAPLDVFLAALQLWRWSRTMAGQPTGDAGPVRDLEGQLRASLKA